MRLPLPEELVTQLHQYCNDKLEEFVAECISVCEIPAPGFAEEQRARYVKQRFESLGCDVWIDSVGNVIARIAGNRKRPVLMLAAHMDTVFPAGCDVAVRRESGKLYAPGIRDNSAGVAALIMLAQALQRFPQINHGEIYLVATVGEEGLGDLRGMKAAYQELRELVDYCIAVDGGLGGIVHAGIASRRLAVSCSTGGGHSWGDFGVPSAIHAVGRMIAEIDSLTVPREPRTTYNVGVVEGGTSVNTIAAQAKMLIDMRSTDVNALRELERRVRSIINSVAERQNVSVSIDVVGDRPGGVIRPDHPLVKTAELVLKYLGLPHHLVASSTDANIPLSHGTPAICVGVTTGSNAHRLDESMDIAPLPKGLLQLLLVIALVSQR